MQQLCFFFQAEDGIRDLTVTEFRRVPSDLVDHGRGDNAFNWPHHNDKIEGAQNIWFAIISPDSALRGEWANHAALFQNQFAATLCQLLGQDYRKEVPEAGPPIEKLFEGR